MSRSLLVAVAAVAAFSTLALTTPVAGAAVTPPWDPFFAGQATVADFGATTRPFGVAAGDFDDDGNADLVVGRDDGQHRLPEGQRRRHLRSAPIVFAWKQAFFNAWAFAAGDVNGDGNLDVVWGANAASSGTSLPGGLRHPR